MAFYFNFSRKAASSRRSHASLSFSFIRFSHAFDLEASVIGLREFANNGMILFLGLHRLTEAGRTPVGEGTHHICTRTT